MNSKPLFEIFKLYYPVSLMLLNSQYTSRQHVEPDLLVIPYIKKVPRKPAFWEMRLDIKTPDDISPNTFPYIFALTVYGYLRCEFPKEMSREDILQRRTLLFVNGASVLYSAARDRLLLSTSGFPYPPYCLPSFRFVPTKPPKSDANP
jgi:hypothetical protein